MLNQNDSPTDLENIISNDEEINEFYGDLMLVTRKKKSQSGPTQNSKNVHNKSKRFQPLSQLAHQVKPNYATNKNILKPLFNSAPRVIKSHMETKRRRQEDDPFDNSLNFPNIKSSTGPILSLPTDQHGPHLTKANTKLFDQTLNSAMPFASNSKTKAFS